MFKIIADPKNERVFNITSKMPITSKTGMRQGLYKIGSLLRDDLRIEILKKPKSGKEYLVRRGGRRFRHIAAADGETPANIHGEKGLRGSVDFKVSGATQLEFGYDNSVDYGKYLEQGTKNMNPKPGLLNSINKNRLKGINIMGNEVMNRMTK